jgi:glutamyl-tRNA synthetase
LVLNAVGKRLAKRDGAVTVGEIGMPTALIQIAESLGTHAESIDELLMGFDPTRLPTKPWTYQPN